MTPLCGSCDLRCVKPFLDFPICGAAGTKKRHAQRLTCQRNGRLLIEVESCHCHSVLVAQRGAKDGRVVCAQRHRMVRVVDTKVMRAVVGDGASAADQIRGQAKLDRSALLVQQLLVAFRQKAQMPKAILRSTILVVSISIDDQQRSGHCLTGEKSSILRVSSSVSATSPACKAILRPAVLALARAGAHVSHWP